jgi:general secretion pathway protein I
MRRPGTSADAQSRSGEQGFTLIEMIVALAILSIALGTLFAGFSQGLERQRLNATQRQARVLAQRLLQQGGTSSPLREGATRGIAAGGLHWALLVKPFGDPADRKAWLFAPVRVTAHVAWTMDGQGHVVELATLRALPAEVKP